MNLPTLSPALEYDIVSSIIQAVGRTITLVYVDTRSVCPVCGGTNPFCSTCHGNPTVDITTERDITANVKWRSNDKKIYRPEGQFVEGDCTVNFMIDALDDYATTDAVVKKITSVRIDGRICLLSRYYFKGSPINRVYLILTQDEDIGGQRVG